MLQNTVKPDLEQKINHLEAQIVKMSKDADAIKLSKKQADKEKLEAMRKLKDN